jgi:CHAD domain-containing protein
LKDYSALLTKEFRKSKDGLSQVEWPADATAVALRLSSELAQWPPLRRNNLHPFRLKIKKLRYILQMARGRDGGLVSKLGEVKDAIGKWHDWTELCAIATEILDHRPPRNLIKQIRSTTDTKLDRALSLAVRMRSKYLGVGNKAKSSRRRKLPRMKEPVVSTAAKLAA